MSFDEDKKDGKDKGFPISNLNKLSNNWNLKFYRYIVSLNMKRNCCQENVE